MLGQGSEPCVGGSWGQGPQDARWELALVMLLKIIHRGGLRPDSQTVNGHHFTAVCQVHDSGSDAKKIALVRVHDVQSQTDCHPSINRIAATP